MYMYEIDKRIYIVVSNKSKRELIYIYMCVLPTYLLCCAEFYDAV